MREDYDILFRQNIRNCLIAHYVAVNLTFNGDTVNETGTLTELCLLLLTAWINVEFRRKNNRNSNQ